MGILRSYNAMQKLSGGFASLRRAYGFRDRAAAARPALPGCVDSPGGRTATGAGEVDADVQPVSGVFPCGGQLVMRLKVQNQLFGSIALCNARSSPKYEFAPISAELLGRMNLRSARTRYADKAFAVAIRSGLGSSKAWRAAGSLRTGGSTRPRRAWPKPSEIDPGAFRTGHLYLDQGKWDSAACREAGARLPRPAYQAGSARAFFHWPVAQWAKGDHQAVAGDA